MLPTHLKNITLTILCMYSFLICRGNISSDEAESEKSMIGSEAPGFENIIAKKQPSVIMP